MEETADKNHFSLDRLRRLPGEEERAALRNARHQKTKDGAQQFGTFLSLERISCAVGKIPVANFTEATLTPYSTAKSEKSPF